MASFAIDGQKIFILGPDGSKKEVDTIKLDMSFDEPVCGTGFLDSYKKYYTLEATFTDGSKGFAKELLGDWGSGPESDKEKSSRYLSDKSKKLPAMEHIVNSPPCDCGEQLLNLRWVIMHLNDYHKWSREDIADWIDLWAIENNVDISF